uniref:Uncharacterized protein n=1 Tax=Salix viminalis TaxID=40686 RepID=A0A6N2KLG2_SALVM
MGAETLHSDTGFARIKLQILMGQGISLQRFEVQSNVVMVRSLPVAMLRTCRHSSMQEFPQNDVQKLLKLLQNEQIQAVLGSPFVGEKEKGQVVQEVAKRGKFNRYLLGLVKMLIERNKVMIVSDVLMEFERIYDELSGTKVVLVSSPTKMKEDQLFWIAKTVQNRSGAVSVKVKNFFDEKLPAPVV